MEVDHSTLFPWIQAYAAELEKRIRPDVRISNDSWRVNETYVKVKGRRVYLYRAVGRGARLRETIDPPGLGFGGFWRARRTLVGQSGFTLTGIASGFTP